MKTNYVRYFLPLILLASAGIETGRFEEVHFGTQRTPPGHGNSKDDTQGTETKGTHLDVNHGAAAQVCQELYSPGVSFREEERHRGEWQLNLQVSLKTFPNLLAYYPIK